MSNNNWLFEDFSKQEVVVYLHGYGGDKNDLPLVRKYITENLRMSFFSFSYDMSFDNGDKRRVKDIEAEMIDRIELFLKNNHFEKIYLIGYSLGAAFAVDLVASGLIKFDKLVLISVFDDRRSFLKDRGMLIEDGENISPVEAIKKIKNTPIAFIHGEFDRSINPERGIRVFDKANKQLSEFFLLPFGHHFDEPKSKEILLENLGKIL